MITMKYSDESTELHVRCFSICKREAVFMAKRLTEERKQKIVADYIQFHNFSEVARQNGVSDVTVRNIVKNSDSPEISRKLEQKKEEVSEDILLHMETKKDLVNEIIDTYLEKLLDPLMIAKANPSQLTTALGTLIDKFTLTKTKVVAPDAEDDPLTKALKEEAERMNHGDLT
jgi:hypothetical protein